MYTILIIIWLVLIIPAIAFFKAYNEKIYTIGGYHVLEGIFWPIYLILVILGQILLVLGNWLGDVYEWLCKFFEKHI